jgi:diacylglycerol kinase family enzyme
MEKIPHLGDGQAGVIPQSTRIDPTASGTRRAISLVAVGVNLSSSGALEVFPPTAIWDVRYAVLESNACWEHLVRLSHHIADGMRISHRSSLGLEPIHSLIS